MSEALDSYIIRPETPAQPPHASPRSEIGRRRVLRWPGACTLVAILLCAVVGTAAAQTMTLKHGHVGEVAQLGEARRAAPYRQLDLKLELALRDRGALDQLLADQQDPASPEYQRWLTPEEFDARFAPVEADFQAAADWLKSQGFNVASSSRAERSVRFNGSVSQAERVFGVRIVSSADDRSYGNLEDPTLPAGFAGVIGHLEGLDNLRHYVPLARAGRDRRGMTPAEQTLPSFELISFVPGGVPAASRSIRPEFNFQGTSAFGPGDVYTFYDETPVLNSGINGGGKDCIALIDDSNYLSAAVDLFDSTLSLPAANITRVFPTTDPRRNGDEGETLLDLQWAHAIAPGAPLRVYIGNPKDQTEDPITAGIRKAVKENRCSAISISFAACGATQSFLTETLDPIFKQAASQGQSIFVSSGDQGAAGLVLDPVQAACVLGTSRNVNEMSASSYVTAVGGTQFNPNFDSSGNDVGFVAEKAWGEGVLPTDPSYPGRGATGGGVSAVFPKPAYQNGVTPADGFRDVPDISTIASADLPGVFLGNDVLGRGAVFDCCNGGTSLSAPIWAGISRLIVQATGKRLGIINPRIYALAASASAAQAGLRDVTAGSNDYNGVAGFAAGPGYDLATGWGTADIAQLVAAFPNAAPTPIPGTLALSTTSINFPATGIDTTTVTRSFKIKNSGKGTLSGSLDLSMLQTPFAVSGAASFSLGHKQSRIVSIQFTPTAAGKSRGSIGIVSNDAKGRSPTQVNVSGTGTPGTLSASSTLAFGKVQVNKTKRLAMTIRNTGHGALHFNVDVSTLVAPFTASPSAGQSSLAPGKAMLLQVVFSPTSKQGSPFKSRITITSDDPSHQTLTIIVTGMAI